MSTATTTQGDALSRAASLQAFFDNLDSFAEAPEGVVNLRGLILDSAVQGKLVRQDENDEPASVLLGRIEEDRERLIADGELRRPRKEIPLNEDDLPFHVPRGWAWVKLGRIMKKMGAGSTPIGGKRVYVNDGVMFLRSQNVWNDGLRLDTVARIPPGIHDDMSGTHVESGDVLLNITGASIGRCALVGVYSSRALVARSPTGGNVDRGT